MNTVFRYFASRSCPLMWLVAVAVLLLFLGAPGLAETVDPASDEEAVDLIRIGLPELTMYGLDRADARLAMDRIFQLAWVGTAGFTSEIYENNRDFYQAISDGRVDLAPMLIEEFLNRPPGCEVDPVLQGVSDDTGGGTELILLARKDLDLKTLGGKKLLLDSAQQLAVPWLDLVLADEGLAENASHFGVVAKRDNSKDAVLQTFFGQADACMTSQQAFDMLAELNPQLQSRLKVIAKSEPMAMHVICVASSFDEERRKSLLARLRELHHNPAGRQLLLLTKINRIDFCDSSLVEAARKLMERWEVLQATRKKEWLKKQKQHVVAKPVPVADETREEAR